MCEEVLDCVIKGNAAPVGAEVPGAYERWRGNGRSIPMLPVRQGKQKHIIHMEIELIRNNSEDTIKLPVTLTFSFWAWSSSKCVER